MDLYCVLDQLSKTTLSPQIYSQIFYFCDCILDSVYNAIHGLLKVVLFVNCPNCQLVKRITAVHGSHFKDLNRHLGQFDPVRAVRV